MRHLEKFNNFKVNENWYGNEDKDYSDIKLDMTKFLKDLDYTFSIVKELNPRLKTWRDEAFMNEKSEWEMSCEIEFIEFGCDDKGKVNHEDKSLHAVYKCKERLIKMYIGIYMEFYKKYENVKIPCKRVISVDSLDNIDWDNIGKYWSFDNKDGSDFSNPNLEYKVEFNASVNRSDVDWLNSLDNYVYFDESENEIKLLRGSNITIDYMDVSTFNTDTLQKSSSPKKTILNKEVSI